METMAPYKNLETKFDRHKSFYGKARVQRFDFPGGTVKVLWSYDTEICRIAIPNDAPFKVCIREGQPQSATTRRHLYEFLCQEVGVEFAQRLYSEVLRKKRALDGVEFFEDGEETMQSVLGPYLVA